MKDDNLIKTIRASLEDSARMKTVIADVMIPQVAEVVRLLASCIESGHKILIMGNGGSSSDAQHMAAELVGRFEREREPIPAISLTTDSSVLTAIGNDFGFDEVFAKQVQALAHQDDVVICFSTSGESENVIKAALRAKEIGAKVVGFLGERDCTLVKLADISLRVPSSRTCRIQEGHITLVHVICEGLDDYSIGKDK
jgi:D-sedoheptulose 7-phosphate isomerase